MRVAPHRRLVWWTFDHTPQRFQAWVEAWARTLILRRQRSVPLGWVTTTSPNTTNSGATVITVNPYRRPDG